MPPFSARGARPGCAGRARSACVERSRATCGSARAVVDEAELPVAEASAAAPIEHRPEDVGRRFVDRRQDREARFAHVPRNRRGAGGDRADEAHREWHPGDDAGAQQQQALAVVLELGQPALYFRQFGVLGDQQVPQPQDLLLTTGELIFKVRFLSHRASVLRSSIASPRMPQPETHRPAWLVLPTYEEAGNIESLVRKAVENLPADSTVLVVDDNSPDGTGDIAERLSTELPVKVLRRRGKEGLASAYIAGFRRALEGGAGLVLQMDSDFSHDPADLRRLVEASERADVVLGSRYVAGGGVTEWSLLRKAISRGGSAYARTVLGIEIKDLTGGFKCFRREVLEALDLNAISSQGYAFQVEMTYRALQSGFKVVEVPIVFKDRQVGNSKMSRAIVLEAMWRVPLLRFRTHSP